MLFKLSYSCITAVRHASSSVQSPCTAPWPSAGSRLCAVPMARSGGVEGGRGRRDALVVTACQKSGGSLFSFSEWKISPHGSLSRVSSSQRTDRHETRQSCCLINISMTEDSTKRQAGGHPANQGHGAVHISSGIGRQGTITSIVMRGVRSKILHFLSRSIH